MLEKILQQLIGGVTNVYKNSFTFVRAFPLPLVELSFPFLSNFLCGELIEIGIILNIQIYFSEIGIQNNFYFLFLFYFDEILQE